MTDTTSSAPRTPIVGVECNGCRATLQIAAHTDPPSKADEARVVEQALALGWCETGPGHLCPVCITASVKAAPTGTLRDRPRHATKGGYSGSMPADQVPPPPATPSANIRPTERVGWALVPARVEQVTTRDRIVSVLRGHHVDKTALTPVNGVVCTCGETVEQDGARWPADGLDTHRAEHLTVIL